jgi:hypothetical protein
MRARVENVGKVKKYVAAVGASEMVRIMDEMGVVGEHVLVTGPRMKVKGDWTEEKMLEEMEGCEVQHTLLVFGPGNGMVEHGRKGSRGTGGEVELIMEGEGKTRTEYHLTEPTSRMAEEREYQIHLVYGLMRGLRKLCGGRRLCMWDCCPDMWRYVVGRRGT